MTKKQAPAVRPAKTVKTTKPKSTNRGKYIDFRPRRQPQPVQRVRRKTVIEVTKKPALVEEPIEELIDAPVEEPIEVIEPLETVADFIASEDEADVDDYVSELAEVAELADAVTELAKDSAAESIKISTTSPFIASVNVDKRPLSSRRIVTEEDYISSAPTTIREEDFHGEIKNTYTTRRERRDLQDPREKLRGHEEKKSISPSFIIAIVLTILLGAGVGAFIYLVFFQ